MKYEANAGPPKGDHPIDRAINALPLPQYPIAPPVAAGSVDTEEFRILLRARENTPHQSHPALIAHIDAWGAQQREAALAEQESVFRALIQKKDDDINMFVQRAEKAEARVKKLEAAISFSDSPFYIPIDNKGGTPV